MVTENGGTIANTSTEDYNGTTSGSSPSFSGLYTAGGTGRFTLNNFTNFVPSNAAYAAYPYATSSSSQGLLLLEIDGAGVTTGSAYSQTSTTFAAAQGYALNLSGINFSAEQVGLTFGPTEVDDIAEFTAYSSGNTCGSGDQICGIIDENADPGGVDFGAPFFGMPLDGNYTPPDSNGRGTITANAGNINESTLNGGFALTFYTVDGTTFPFIETDGGQIAVGVMTLQTPTSSSAAAEARSHMFVPRPLVQPRALRKKK